LVYRVFSPHGSMELFVFTIIFGIVTMVLSQLPSFHSLRYINLGSLLCSLGYSLCAVGGCIHAGGLSLPSPASRNRSRFLKKINTAEDYSNL
jgi:hypothetical protein